MSLLENEKEVQAFWKEHQIFEKQSAKTNKNKPRYTFYDGPPFATGTPHYGHILAGTIKDVITRFQCMKGYDVPRQFGWDCHGLPIENIVDQRLNIQSKTVVQSTTHCDDKETHTDKWKQYHEECRNVVMQCEADWETTVERMGRWVDFKNSYKTMDVSYMSHLWSIFAKLYEKGLIYQGKKVMPISTALGTPLSNFEANLNYKTVTHPDAYVLFPLVLSNTDTHTTFLLAWTTTPWTLPAHVALCVNPDMEYITYHHSHTQSNTDTSSLTSNSVPPDAYYIVGAFYKAPSSWKEVSRCKGRDLVGLTYTTPFPYLYADPCVESYKPPTVVADTFVQSDVGTGIIHLAPCFGEEDYRVCKENGWDEESFPCPVTLQGTFTTEIISFEGRSVHDPETTKDIFKYLKQCTPSRLWKQTLVQHSYPHCWRTDTPLIYRAVTSWFLRVEDIRDRMIHHNANVTWIPATIGENRFHNWLHQAKDWSLSRTRIWGTPLPIWASEDGKEVRIVSSKEELETLTQTSLADIHRESIDALKIPSRDGTQMLRRIPEVFDCWFESGAVPIVQSHLYNHSLDAFIPADFVAEGLDQTRGWFYTMLVLSTALYDQAPYKHVLCSGLILAEDGKKMSKRLKNYTDPTCILEKYGADALRMYLLNSPVVKGETLRFKDEGVFAMCKDILLPLVNAVQYFKEYAFHPIHPDGVPSQELHPMDTWILHYMHRFVTTMHTDLSNYHLEHLVSYIQKCVHTLTNIYIRMNRYRFRNQTESKVPSVILYKCLDLFAKACAPVIPFHTEWIYQQLHSSTSTNSVHMEAYPTNKDDENHKENENEKDESLVYMETFETMIEEVRRIRLENKWPMKRPLKNVRFIHASKPMMEFLKTTMLETFQKELNVMNVEFDTTIENYVKTELIPVPSAIGKTFGKKSKDILTALSKSISYSYKDISPELELGIHVIQKYTLLTQPVSSSTSPSPTLRTYLDKTGQYIIQMDLCLTDEIIKEEHTREIVHTVNMIRKEMGVKSKDICDVYIQESTSNSTSSSTTDIIHKERIQEELAFNNHIYFTPLPFPFSLESILHKGAYKDISIYVVKNKNQ